MSKKTSVKNIKITKQRKVIMEIISSANDHPTVDQIFERAASITNNISKATVYRNIKKLTEEGVVLKHDFGFGKSHYELNSSIHHHHLIDIESKQVLDFASDELETLKEKIALEHGYKLLWHRLDMYVVPLKKNDKEESDE